MAERVTNEMLNAGQERICQLRNVTHFDDEAQAAIYEAMRELDPAYARMQEALRVERGIVGALQWMISDQQRYRCEHGVQRFLICEECHVAQEKGASGRLLVLIERLREICDDQRYSATFVGTFVRGHNLADTITRLQAALEHIAEEGDAETSASVQLEGCKQTAREALSSVGANNER